jgi:hypothetical protein
VQLLQTGEPKQSHNTEGGGAGLIQSAWRHTRALRPYLVRFKTLYLNPLQVFFLSTI